MYLIAHRGDSAHSPENTLRAFRMAKEKGADSVEFDVMLTQDGEAIIFHDETLDRTTTGSGLISEHTLEQIKSMDAGEWFNGSFKNERVPTLIETIQLLIELDLNANIEIKPCGDTAIQTTRATLDIIKKYWPENKKPPLISSFNQYCLEQSLKLAPEYPRGLLLDAWQDDCCELATKYQCVNINLDHNGLIQEHVSTIKNAGFKIYVFTVNDGRVASALEGMGVDGIFSDNPMILTNNVNEAPLKVTGTSFNTFQPYAPTTAVYHESTLTANL